MAMSDKIERYFEEGVRQAELDEQEYEKSGGKSEQSHNPYEGDLRYTVALHWWNWGYSYQARLYRAFRVERELADLQAEIYKNS